MATTTDELKLIITAQTAGIQQGLNETKSQISDLNKQAKSSQTAFSGASKSIAGMIAKVAGAAAIFTGLKTSISLSIQEVENWNLFAVSLGNSAEAAAQWASVVENKLGVSAAWIRQYTGVMTNMVSSMGLNEASATALGKSVALLSQDFASFYNRSPEEMFEKISSAMAGMPRPLQELGIMVRQSEVEAYALAHGMVRVGEEMSSATKAAATFGAIIEQTKNAQGDLARTLNTPANQLRALGTNFTNLGIAIGNLFIPLAQAVLPVLNAIVIAATSAFQALAGIFGIKIETDSLDSYAGGWDDVGEAATGAAAATKKAQKQLAGFDEMTVLKEPTDTSGGSGGGGGGAGGGMPTIDLSYLNAMNGLMDGIDNKAKQIANAIAGYFGDLFDFKAIGKSFSKLWDDIKKGAKPVFGVIADVWKTYLKPFIGWVGNSMLPATLNAIGGAVQFVGAVIGNTWDKALKPFIDFFVVPIAQFAGSVLVTSLNAIGDALRFIASNQAALDLMTGLGMAIATVFAVDKIMNWISYIQQAIILQTALGTSGNIAIGGLTGVITQFGSAISAAGGGFSGFVSVMQSGITSMGSFIAAAAPLIIVVELITAAYLAWQHIAGAIEIAEANARIEQSKRITVTQEAEMRQNSYNNNLERTNVLLKENTGVILSLNEAELAVMNATKAVETARSAYNSKLNSGKASTQELKEAELEMQIAEGRLQVQKDELAKAQGRLEEHNKQLMNSELTRIGNIKQGEAVELLQQKRYRDLAKYLDEASSATYEYKDAQGNTVRATKEETENLVSSIQIVLARMDPFWRSVVEQSEKTGQSLLQWTATMESMMRSSGSNFQSGLVKGIKDNQWRVNDAAKESAQGAKKAFNSELKIESPSRVMMQSGNWFNIGVAKGIDDSTGEVENSAEHVALAAVSAFDSYAVAGVDFGLSSPSLESMAGEIDMGVERAPVHITIKVGEDTLVDRLIDAVNEASMMRDSSVIMV